jgi:anti-sigma B factor antagonist
VTTVDVPSEGFAVTVSFEGSRAVLGVRGEVDFFRASDLGALLHAVIAQSHRSVVIDLAGLAFIDASGLRVIADGANHLRKSGGKLTVRSPSAMFRRIVEITGLSGLVQLGQTATVAAHPGAEESIDLPETPRLATLPDLAHQMRAITAVPADHDMVDGTLRLVVALARATVGGGDGVSVSLRRHGRLATVAASDQTISDMDANQYPTGETPCVDASVEGRWLHAEALDIETRWPAFTPKDQELAAMFARGFDRPDPCRRGHSRRPAGRASRRSAPCSSDHCRGPGGDHGARGHRRRQLLTRCYARSHRARTARFASGQKTSWLPPSRSPTDPHQVPMTAIMADDVAETLDMFRRDAGLSHGGLWLRYFELGGMCTAFQLEAFLYGALEPGAHDREVIAQALNERFVELGGNHPVPYVLASNDE